VCVRAPRTRRTRHLLHAPLIRILPWAIYRAHARMNVRRTHAVIAHFARRLQNVSAERLAVPNDAVLSISNNKSLN
jgi:hypothetical protein